MSAPATLSPSIERGQRVATLIANPQDPCITTELADVCRDAVGASGVYFLADGIACDLPLEKVKARYGNQYSVIMGDLKQTDDLRVLDYNGYNVFHNFTFSEMGKPIYHEP